MYEVVTTSRLFAASLPTNHEITSSTAFVGSTVFINYLVLIQYLEDHTTINSLINTFGRYFANKIAKLRFGLLTADADAPVSGSYKNKFVSFQTMLQEDVLKVHTK